MALQVELVSAEGKVWDGKATRVIAKTMDGELGILPGHAPLLGILVEGTVRVTGEGGDVVASVDGGVLSVDHDHVILAAESASVTSGATR